MLTRDSDRSRGGLRRLPLAIPGRSTCPGGTGRRYAISGRSDPFGAKGTQRPRAADALCPALRGKLTASVLLAILDSACGVVPYLAVSQILIRLCGGNCDFGPIAGYALLGLAGYLGNVWLSAASTMLSHHSAFTVLKEIRTALTAKLSRVPMGTVLDPPPASTRRCWWTRWRSWSCRWRI